MQKITKAEAKNNFFAIKDKANSIANLQGTTPDKCDDPLCEKYRRLLMTEFMEEDTIVIADDNGLPYYFLPQFHADKQSRERGIMAIDGDDIKDLYFEDNLLIVQYNDDSIERYQYHKPADAYYFHSHNRNMIDMPAINPN